MRKCKNCHKTKELNINNFRITKNRSGNIYFRRMCIDCERQKSLKYRYSNLEKVTKYNDKWRKENPNYKKKYKEKNREEIRKYTRKYEAQPQVRLKKRISRRIKQTILKNGKSVTKFLPYTIVQLKDHLESQFKPWMSWENWGIYDPSTWDDNDSATWTWQLDHIIPHSKFKYSSMEDDEFRRCWALSNLRPLASKRNIMEGASRIRHK